jgi:putative transposase
VDDPVYKDQKLVVWADVNVKHNLLATSEGEILDYDRKHIKDAIKLLKRLDSIWLKNISDRDRKKLNKLVLRNEWYFKTILAEFLDKLLKSGVTDLVMEDLNLTSSSFIMNEEFGIKYSRLIRLLRLSNISNWMKSMCEKRWIRLHITNPAYTSQACSRCGYIDKENRKTQEDFDCLECWYQENADTNAAKNIRSRYSLDVLRNKFHKVDSSWIMTPIKFMKREVIKRFYDKERFKFIGYPLKV